MPETHLLPLLWGRRREIRRLGRRGLAEWLRGALPKVNRSWTSADAARRLEAMCDRFRDDAHGRADVALTDGGIGVFEECLGHWSDVTGKPRPGEKTPSHIYYVPALLRAMPSAHVVIMHRDPRAAACSEWIKHQAIKEPGRRFGWFPFAVRWATGVEVARRCERQFGSHRVLQLRYEDMTAEPEVTARQLCGFIGERFDPAMLVVERQGSSFVDPGVPKDNRNIGIDASTRDRWRQTLDERAVARVESLAGRWMDELGYEAVAFDSAAASRWERWRLDAMAAWARRYPAMFNQLASRARYRDVAPLFLQMSA